MSPSASMWHSAPLYRVQLQEFPLLQIHPGHSRNQTVYTVKLQIDSLTVHQTNQMSPDKCSFTCLQAQADLFHSHLSVHEVDRQTSTSTDENCMQQSISLTKTTSESCPPRPTGFLSYSCIAWRYISLSCISSLAPLSPSPKP